MIILDERTGIERRFTIESDRRARLSEMSRRKFSGHQALMKFEGTRLAVELRTHYRNSGVDLSSRIATVFINGASPGFFSTTEHAGDSMHRSTGKARCVSESFRSVHSVEERSGADAGEWRY